MRRSMMRLSPALVFVLTAPWFVGCQTGGPGMNTNLADENRELRRTVEEQRQALDAVEAERASLEGRMNDGGSTTAPLPEPVPQPQGQFGDIEGVESQMQGSDLHVTVASDILFAPGKAKLRESAKKTLNEVIGVLESEYAGETIRIEGHTDTDPIQESPWDDNLELSVQRASAVHRYLQSQGLSAERMYAAGFGDTRPKATKKQSRRVEIVVTGQ